MNGAASADLGHCPIEYTALGPSEAGQWFGLLITALLRVFLIGLFVFFVMRQATKGKAGSLASV